MWLELPKVEQERIRRAGVIDDSDLIAEAHARMLGAKGATGGKEKSNQEEGGEKAVTGA